MFSNCSQSAIVASQRFGAATKWAPPAVQMGAKLEAKTGLAAEVFKLTHYPPQRSLYFLK
jgi:hypothetical protein